MNTPTSSPITTADPDRMADLHRRQAYAHENIAIITGALQAQREDVESLACDAPDLLTRQCAAYALGMIDLQRIEIECASLTA